MFEVQAPYHMFLCPCVLLTSAVISPAQPLHVSPRLLRQALQDQVAALQRDNQHLRNIMQEEMPKHARDIYGVCSTVPGAHTNMPTQGDLVPQDLTLMQVRPHLRLLLAFASLAPSLFPEVTFVSPSPEILVSGAHFVPANLHRFGPQAARQPYRVCVAGLPQPHGLQNGPGE